MSILRAMSCMVMVGTVSWNLGCTMCQGPDDVSYSASGGRWQRLDPVYGRVGSIFTPESGARADEVAPGMLDEMGLPDATTIPGLPESSLDAAEVVYE